MAKLKTQKTDDSVEAFLNSVEHDKRRTDAFKVLELMKEVTGEEPKMWGSSIVGFGDYHYKYESGREGDWFLIGFSPFFCFRTQINTDGSTALTTSFHR